MSRGRKTGWSRVLVWSLAGAAFAFLLVVLLTQSLSVGVQVTGVLVGFIAIVSLALTVHINFLRDTAGEGRPAAETLADDLAGIVRRQWWEEAEARSLFEPQALRLRWSPTGRPVADEPNKIAGPRPGGPLVRLRLAGELDQDLKELARRFESLPHRRLVILGEPGAGKSVLAILLTLGLAAKRTAGDPAPVLLPVGSWDPLSERLDTWIVRSLASDYYNGRDETPRTLLDQRLLIPVLDGLDEIPETLRSAAIREINRTVSAEIPLVVTCRSAEYEEAVEGQGEVMRRAAVIEIEPVGVDDTIEYLSGVRWPSRTEWAPVFRHLRDHRNGPLARTLSTPLMVSLVRTIYGRRGDPSELLDQNRFGHREAAEDELLDMVIPAAYAPDDDPAPGPAGKDTAVPRWTAASAEEWLTWLADHMHQARERDFAWWRLSRRALTAWTAPVVGILIGLVFTVLSVVWWRLLAGSRFDPRDALGPVAVVALSAGSCVTIIAIVIWYANVGRPPERLVLSRHGSLDRIRRGSITGFALLCILLIPATVGLGVGLLDSSEGLLRGMIVPLAQIIPLWLVASAALATQRWLSASPERAAQASPNGLLRQDRRSTLVAAAASGLAAALMLVPALFLSVMFSDLAFLSFSLALDEWQGGRLAYTSSDLFHLLQERLGFAPIVALAFGCLMTLSRAWPQFVIARTALALRRKVPLRLIGFLDDARARGLLRQAGGVYQFRHARLQERLIVRRARPSTVGGAIPAHRAWFRRPVQISLASLGLAVVAVAVPVGNNLRCDDTPWSLSLTTLMQRVPTRDGSECIGILAEEHYDDMPQPKDGSAGDLNPAFKSIIKTNKRAVQDPRHRVVVVAAPFRAGGIYGRTILRRQIEGIALAHRRLNFEDRRSLRLVLATMGSDIRSAARVAEIVTNQARRHKRWAGFLQLGAPWRKGREGESSEVNTLEVFARRGDMLLDSHTDPSPMTPAISASTPSNELADSLGILSGRRIKRIHLLHTSADDGFRDQEQPDSEKVSATLDGGHKACMSRAKFVYAQATDPKLQRAFLEGVAKTCGSADRHVLLVDENIAGEIADENIPGLTMPILIATNASSLTWRNCQDLHKFLHYSNDIGFGDPCRDHWGGGLLSYDVLRLGTEMIFNIRDLKDITFAEKTESFPVISRMRGSPVLRGASGDLRHVLANASKSGYSIPTDDPMVILELRPGKSPPIEYICRYLSQGASKTRPGPLPERPQDGRGLSSALSDISAEPDVERRCQF